MVCQDGTIRWVTARGRFYYTKSGTSERMLGMAVDIAERKQTEEALKKSEEKFAKAFRQSPNGCYPHKHDGPSLPGRQRDFRTGHWLAPGRANRTHSVRHSYLGRSCSKRGVR